ncbi:MAG: methyltransferase [Deltaproteobacteria bacterium]|nr:methyltransferase [Deltaproteobacteria bacterium]
MKSAEQLEARRVELEATINEPVTLDFVAGEFRLFQRKRGHRYSTDDLLTAYYAIAKAPTEVHTMLDLGTGIGSIGISCAWKFEEAELYAIEAQEISYLFLRENLWANDLNARTVTARGDLREVTKAPPWGEKLFDLVTGSPPYWAATDGILSPDSQRARARFEMLGDVSDYCVAAKRMLKPEGHFVFCFPQNQCARALKSVADAGLAVRVRQDVFPQAGLPAILSLFCCVHAEASRAAEVVEPALTVRDSQRLTTAEMNVARAVLGLRPKDTGLERS